MVSKVVYGFSFKSYEHFKISKFNKNRKIKVDYNRQNILKKIFDQKGVSAQRKLSSFFKNNVIKKQWFQEQKHEKYLKSKNGVKKLLGAFNQELWAI